MGSMGYYIAPDGTKFRVHDRSEWCPFFRLHDIEGITPEHWVRMHELQNLFCKKSYKRREKQTEMKAKQSKNSKRINRLV